MNVFSKTKTLFWVIRVIRNWPLWLAHYFNLLNKDKEIIFYYRNGLKFSFSGSNKSSWSLKEILKDKIYTKKAEIGDNDIVIDIGAHIGAFSIFAVTSAKNVKVYAYEPAPEIFLRLVKNIKLNNLTKFIKPFNFGIGGKNEERKLFICPDEGVLSSIYPEHVPDIKESVEIKVIALEDIFKDNQIEKCDFLKMDCEGAEYEILFNTSPYYLTKIKNIALEYHYQGFQNLKEFLERNGFLVEVCPDSSSSVGILYAVRDNTLKP